MQDNLNQREVVLLHILPYITSTSGVSLGVQDPVISAGPPDSRRALSSAFFASYLSIGLVSPLVTRARRKIIARTCVGLIWTQKYLETTWAEQKAKLIPPRGRRLFVELHGHLYPRAAKPVWCCWILFDAGCHLRLAPQVGHLRLPSQVGHFKLPPQVAHLKLPPQAGHLNAPTTTPFSSPKVPNLVSTGPVVSRTVPQYFWSVFLAFLMYSAFSSLTLLSTAFRASWPWQWGLYLAIF